MPSHPQGLNVVLHFSIVAQPYCFLLNRSGNLTAHLLLALIIPGLLWQSNQIYSLCNTFIFEMFLRIFYIRPIKAGQLIHSNEKHR